MDVASGQCSCGRRRFSSPTRRRCAPSAKRCWCCLLPLAVYLAVQTWLGCAAAAAAAAGGLAGPPGCPSVCSCTNQFSKVVCTRRGLAEVPAGIPANTRHLNLMENGIRRIQADTFRHLHHLEVLQLGRNAIRQIEVGAFNGLASLNTLELFDNWLTVVPSAETPEYFRPVKLQRGSAGATTPSRASPPTPSTACPPSCAWTWVSCASSAHASRAEGFEIFHNLKLKCGSKEVLDHLSPVIGLIERNAFDDLTALVELNLAHNNLTALPHDLFAPLRYLVELHLHHNPWSWAVPRHPSGSPGGCAEVHLTNSYPLRRLPRPFRLGQVLVEVDQTALP
uniref:Uncharacterized protein n=1 Tax=Sphaerodactylus townsendi TaxID=933632 RepID=A0ACB8FMC0_9SAUR